MARITPGQIRQQDAAYHYYAQPVGGDTTVYVRRSVAFPGVVTHPSSRATKLQRLRFAKATTDWGKLPLSHKYWWRNQLRWSRHSQVLKGMQLYMSDHIAAQIQAEKEGAPPFEKPLARVGVCLQTVSNGLIPIYKPDLNCQFNVPPYTLRGGTRLTDSEWVVPGVPEQWLECKFMTGLNDALLSGLSKATNYNGLARERYIPHLTNASVQLRHPGFFECVTHVTLPNDCADNEIYGDSYSILRQCVHGYYFYFEFTTIVVDPYTIHHIAENYSIPLNSKILMLWGPGDLPPGCLIIHRLGDGSYTYEQTKP